MKHCLVLTLVLLASSAVAQQFPRAEFFGGYQFNGIDGTLFQQNLNAVTQSTPSLSPVLSGQARANGWNGSGALNLKNWMGMLFDFSGAYSTPSLSLASTPTQLVEKTSMQFYTLMAGPQLTYRHNAAWQPFVRGLGGGVIARLSGNLLSNGTNLFAQDIKSDDQGAAYGGGGGLDIRLTRRIYLRIAGDYIRTNLFALSQNNFRASTGLVFREGQSRRARKAPAPAVSPVQATSFPLLGVSGINESNGGIRVVNIVPGGPASQSGLQVGDLLVAINGNVTRTAEDVGNALRSFQPGSKVVVSYMRGYWQSDATVVLK